MRSSAEVASVSPDNGAGAAVDGAGRLGVVGDEGRRAGVVLAGAASMAAAGAGAEGRVPVTGAVSIGACGAVAQAASNATAPKMAPIELQRTNLMAWLLVEALGTAVLILFLVWWTMKPPRQ